MVCTVDIKVAEVVQVTIDSRVSLHSYNAPRYHASGQSYMIGHYKEVYHLVRSSLRLPLHYQPEGFYIKVKSARYS